MRRGSADTDVQETLMPKQGETIEINLDNDKESSVRPKLDDILEDD